MKIQSYMALFCFILSIDIVFAENFMVLIGNPGVGKSEIINACIGKNVAKSGISAGIGLTEFFSAYEFENYGYLLDTPGLADTQMREQAAAQIEDALKQGGDYHLIFIVQLTSGRVRAEDVMTINVVMDAINNRNKNFSIIINKVSSKELALLQDNTKAAAIFAQLNSGKHKTSSIHYIPTDQNLEEGKTSFLTVSEEVKKFIAKTSPSFSIAKKEVGKIQINELDKMRKQFEATLKILRSEINKGDAKYAKTLNEMKSMKNDFLKECEKNRKLQEHLINQAQQSQQPVEVTIHPLCTIL